MTVYVDAKNEFDFKMGNKDAKLVITKNGFYVTCEEDMIIDSSTIFRDGDAWIEMFAPEGFEKYVHINEKKGETSSFGVRIE